MFCPPHAYTNKEYRRSQCQKIRSKLPNTINIIMNFIKMNCFPKSESVFTFGRKQIESIVINSKGIIEKKIPILGEPQHLNIVSTFVLMVLLLMVVNVNVVIFPSQSF